MTHTQIERNKTGNNTLLHCTIFLRVPFCERFHSFVLWSKGLVKCMRLQCAFMCMYLSVCVCACAFGKRKIHEQDSKCDRVVVRECKMEWTTDCCKGLLLALLASSWVKAPTTHSISMFMLLFHAIQISHFHRTIEQMNIEFEQTRTLDTFLHMNLYFLVFIS